MDAVVVVLLSLPLKLSVGSVILSHRYKRCYFAERAALSLSVWPRQLREKELFEGRRRVQGLGLLDRISSCRSTRGRERTYD